MKVYMFRTIPLSIIRSLFTVHSAIVYVIQVYRQLSSRTWMEFPPDPARKEIILSPYFLKIFQYISEKSVLLKTWLS